jgi:hypothetical protein
VDVFAIQRRNEGAVEALHDLVHDPVAFFLDGFHLLRPSIGLQALLEYLHEQLAGASQVLRCPFQEVEELFITGQKRQAQAASTFTLTLAEE